MLVMGADDYLDKNFIENCMKLILSRPDKILALQSPIKGVQADQGIIINEIKHNYRSLEEFKHLSLTKCPVNTPTVIYNTSLYHHGLLETRPELYGGAADYDLYCSLADNGIMIVAAPMWLGFYYRWHEEQATWKVHMAGIDHDKAIQKHWGTKWKI